MVLEYCQNPPTPAPPDASSSNGSAGFFDFSGLGDAGAGLFVVALVGFVACNSSGLSNQPRATFSQLACLDKNGDTSTNAETPTSKVR